MTAATAITWMARLAGIAAAISALELLVVRRALADDGVFRWATLRRDLARAPAVMRAIADTLGSYRGTLLVLGVQLVAAIALALPGLEHPAPAWLVFACALTISVRFRGSYNGGSDSMLLVVVLAVALARSAPGTGIELAALAYCAAQLVLSYFIAGISKLRDPAWLRGTALPQLVQLPQYAVPAWAAALLSRPTLAALAAWAMLAFECASPAALVAPTVCAALLAFGATFHLVNAIVFGLNRFLWAWPAAYPALVYWAAHARTPW